MTGTDGRHPCLFCSEPSSQWHHPTQLAWDKTITVPLCFNHHRAVEDDWPTIGYPPGAAPPTKLHLVVMSLTRWGMLLGRLAMQEVFPSLTRPMGRWCVDAAAMLKTVIATLTAAYGAGWWAIAGMAMD